MPRSIKKKTVKKKAAKKRPAKKNSVSKKASGRGKRTKEAQLEAALKKQGRFMYKRPGEGSDKLIMRTRDIEIVMECSYRTACRHMAKIRKALELLPDQPLSVKEFCKYKRLDEADVQRKLKAY